MELSENAYEMRKEGVLIIFMFILFWPCHLGQTSFIPQGMPGQDGDGEVTFLNSHSFEIETIQYRDQNGVYSYDALAKISHILRCRLTNETIPMSLKLVELLDNIEEHFGGHEIKIVSGYRSAKLNQSLRRRSRRVASQSLHTRGLAADIKIDGVSAREIRDYAKTLHVGGVGYYGQFVHVDVGDVRYW